MKPTIAHVTRCGTGSDHNELVSQSGFFELALSVLSPNPNDPDSVEYPPANGRLTLSSKSGYRRTFKISEGRRTDDECVSFRFDDLRADDGGEKFTAVLEWDGFQELIFQDAKVARFILAAQNGGEYEPVSNADLPSVVLDPPIAPDADETVWDPEAEQDSDLA